MFSRAGGASGRSDADVSSTGRGTCVHGCVQFSDVYATMDAFGLESGVNVHFCVQFTEVYAETDTCDHETVPNRPKLRTVSRSVRRNGHIRPRNGAKPSTVAYSQSKCTQLWTYKTLHWVAMLCTAVVQAPPAPLSKSSFYPQILTRLLQDKTTSCTNK
jgi:hypothetical protein